MDTKFNIWGSYEKAEDQDGNEWTYSDPSGLVYSGSIDGEGLYGAEATFFQILGKMIYRVESAKKRNEYGAEERSVPTPLFQLFRKVVTKEPMEQDNGICQKIFVDFSEQGNFTICAVQVHYSYDGENVLSDVYLGVAKRSTRDKASPHIGKEVALCRALTNNNATYVIPEVND